MSLQDIDDEIQLVQLLQEFCRTNRKKVEVYFDNAPPGSPGARNYGSVIARFVRLGVTADQAIQKKLRRLGGEARNWTVVSSDRDVQVNARTVRAKIIPAEVFAEQLIELMEGPDDTSSQEEGELSPQEVENWLQIFGIEDEDEEISNI
jgi:predicted RNA-binding protein with PIN domain